MPFPVLHGGPAFPGFEGQQPGGYPYPHGGMTQRQYYAARAMEGLIASGINPSLPGDPAVLNGWPDAEELAERRARYAWLQADAMMAMEKAK